MILPNVEAGIIDSRSSDGRGGLDVRPKAFGCQTFGGADFVNVGARSIPNGLEARWSGHSGAHVRRVSLHFRAYTTRQTESLRHSPYALSQIARMKTP
jgi:hypothetical protein